MRVLAVGNICVDIVNYCDQFPDEDTDSRVLEQNWVLGGNATNTVNVLQQLGSEAFLLSVFAEDHLKPILTQLLNEANLSRSFCITRTGAQTPNSIITVGIGNATRTILHTDNRIRHIKCAELEQHLELFSYDWIHFEGYATNIPEIRAMINAVGAKTLKSLELELLDPEGESLIPGCDVVFISKDVAKNRGFQSKEEAARNFGARFPDTVIVCAWGEQGAAGFERGSVVSQKAFPPETVMDTLGAGDTFNAAFIHAFGRKQSLKDSLCFACKIAGFKCGKRGLVHLNLEDVSKLNE